MHSKGGSAVTEARQIAAANIGGHRVHLPTARNVPGASEDHSVADE